MPEFQSGNFETGPSPESLDPEIGTALQGSRLVQRSIKVLSIVAMAILARSMLGSRNRPAHAIGSTCYEQHSPVAGRMY
ncbi:hypothetical protein MKX08_000571 [Trichoderma sp. CBMAI-0020]|nr:hypothetical protein MKX08_000571 [Trichoderma sp. CBMAI-0020]